MLLAMVPLTMELVDFLLSGCARVALEDVMQLDLSAEHALSVITYLRKSFSPGQAAVLLDQARLRHRAKVKFQNASQMWFTDEALQQATSPEVAQYHTDLFDNLRSEQPVADLGCGIGGDTICFATRFNVIAIEQDPIRYKLAEANLDVCGLSHRVDLRCADWTAIKLSVDGAYIDPVRRITTPQGDHKRVFHLSQMQPPLSAVLTLQRNLPHLGVKVAPGVKHKEIPDNAEVTFVSVRGQMKEALLRFGDLRNGTPRTAVLLPGNESIGNHSPCDALPLREPGLFLYEPDAAVIRAGLVEHIGTLLGLAQLDSEIAYLTGDHLCQSPFVRAWCVRRSGSFLLKKLNRWLRELGAGRVVIKKRGSPIDVDKFRNLLKVVKGGPQFTVFLTRVKDSPWMIVAERCIKCDENVA